MNEFIEVHTTIDTREGAQKIADTLVSKRLAACVQISGPISSTYWWDGKMEQAQEWVCTAKTRKDLYRPIGVQQLKRCIPTKPQRSWQLLS